MTANSDSGTPEAGSDSILATLVDRARGMIPNLRERAPEAEENRRLQDETHRQFFDAGFYRIFQPKRYGGYELDFSALIDINAEIGRGCGSAAWIFANLAGQGWINGMKDLQAQEDVWGSNPDALICASFPGPGATARKVDGGYVADGTWIFSSGVDFADWNNLQLFIRAEGKPPEHRFALIPKSDYEIIDDWFVSGLAATGSRSVVVKEVFIPEHRAISAAQVVGGPTPGSAVNPSPIYKLPLFAIGNKQFSSAALGIALGALELTEADIVNRRSVAGVKLAEQQTVQLRIAEAAAELQAAQLLLESDCRESTAVAMTDATPTAQERARWRRNNAYAGKLCVQAVERLFPLAGGRGLGFALPFQRAFRDVHAATSQGSMPWDVQAVFYGQSRFELALDDPRIFPDKKPAEK